MKIPELQINRTTESVNLDFKSVYWSRCKSPAPECKGELAKDIAGMANAAGGHLVIGAAEHESGDLLKVFIDPKLPEKWQGTFREVIATWLVPEPIVEFKLYAFDPPGPKQLIIKVEPSINTVMVRNPNDNKRQLTVPLRRGTHTIYVPPMEAVAMLNHPYRRFELAFRKILELQDSGVAKYLQLFALENNDAVIGEKWSVFDVSPEFAVLTSRDGKLILPFYLVDTVYPLNMEETYWRVLFRGVLRKDLGHPKIEGYQQIIPVG